MERDSVDDAAFKLVKAPPVQRLGVAKRTDLGDWHDIFIMPDTDSIILRRDTALYTLDATADGEPQKLGEFDELRGSRIVFSGEHADATWLFFYSDKSVPFALNPKTGKMAAFDIPGLTVPGSHTPGIQGWVLAEQLGGVVLMISGGDKASWPRDGNRPVYFWFDLETGRVVQMPIGYDLYFLSADQTVAIFRKPYKERYKPTESAALDMETGVELDRVPDRRTDQFTPWTWTETHAVKGVRAPESKSQTELLPGALIGVSTPGRTWRFASHLGSKVYLWSPQIHDGWIGLQLRQEGDCVAPALYCGRLDDEIKLRQISDRAVQFQLFSEGRCVYVESGYGEKGRSHEAFVGDLVESATWNVLEDIERLPALAPEVAKKPHFDLTRIQLVRSFGNPNVPRLVLCLFTQQQGDIRSHAFPLSAEDQVPFRTWRQAILLGPEEERMRLDVLDEKDRPEHIWLHGSGRLFLGVNAQQPSVGENGAIRLQRVTLDAEVVESD